MKLSTLLTAIETISPIKISHDPMISSIENDHRHVTAGSLFICIKGYTVDGHSFAEAAVKNGAVAIIAERQLQVNVPVIVVTDSQRAMAKLASKFYHNENAPLQVIGITGTNGKTTTTHLVEHIFSNANQKTGLIGTIHSKIGERTITMKNTTPDSLTVHKLLHEMAKENVETVVMEVSSHALQLGRVHGVDFQIALFTNLSQDHLDFHHTMENYAQAKSLLFSQLGNKFSHEKQKIAIFNSDDKYAEKLKKATAAAIVTYGINNEADVMAQNINILPKGTSFKLVTPVGSQQIDIPLAGKFNVYNVLAAVSIALAAKIPFNKIVDTLLKTKGVVGRFELIDGGQDFTVIVDYAHTPDGLENVLTTIREFAKERIFVVVGCGGDRDKTKRPLMAQIACQIGTDAIFTSDNPRSENPDKILKDMEAGVKNEQFVSIVDREEAINYAIDQAKAGDVILIAGKGHETTQVIGKEVLDFSDRSVALSALKRRVNK